MIEAPINGATSKGLPPALALLHASLDMLGGCPLPWLAAVFEGDLCSDPEFVNAMLDAGGHLHVGREDFGGQTRPTNV